MGARPRKIVFDDGDVVTVEWDARLGRLTEGYARGGDYVNGRIRLAGGQTRHGLRHTLLHEASHHAWRRAGLDQFLSEKTEELVLDSLIAWLLDTIRANPELRDYLFAED